MRQLTLFALLVALGGCGETAPAIKIDPDFGVCARLPEGYAIEEVTGGVDYSRAVIFDHSSRIDVYLGFAPNFPREAYRDQVGASGTYVLVGETFDEGKEKMLLANRRYPDRGPLFVMLSAPSLEPIRKSILEHHFLEDCGPSVW